METAQQITEPLHWVGQTLDEATDGEALARGELEPFPLLDHLRLPLFAP